VKTGVRIAGSVVLLAVLAWRVDLAGIALALAGVRWGWWLAAALCLLAAQLVSAVRWRQLARPMGFDATRGEFTSLYFVGNFFNLLLPTSVGGDVLRAWYLDNGSGRRWPAFVTVLADRLSGLFVLMVLACVAALLVPLPPLVRGWALLAGVVAAAGLAAFVFFPRRIESAEGWRAKLAPLADAVAVYRRRPALLAGATALAVVVQVANVVVGVFLAWALGLDVPAGYFFVLVPLVTLLTLAPVSLSGMGVREGGTVLLLAPWGVPAEPAVTLALLWFAVFVTAGLVGAGCYLFGRFPRYEEGCHDAAIGRDPGQGRVRQSGAAA
jgi:uncharacterized membrane protein YbhN (UPF0104 family)